MGPVRPVGRAPRAVIIDGTNTMDVRFAVFNLVARDVLLRTLLVNYADRLDSGAEAAPSESCFLVMRWAEPEPASGAAGPHVVTLRAHVPRDRTSEHDHLDHILDRVRWALSVGARHGPLSIQCRDASGEVVDISSNTIARSVTFEVVEKLAHEPAALLDLPGWRGDDDLSVSAPEPLSSRRLGHRADQR
jgi:hypothetical protein